jgi:hypothetical protein
VLQLPYPHIDLLIGIVQVVQKLDDPWIEMFHGETVLTDKTMLKQKTHYLVHIYSKGSCFRCRNIRFRTDASIIRLSLITNTSTIVWFITAHVLAYSSVDSCRHTSPHLWWLTFGILCILYFMLLEIFLVGLLIFILGPILYVRTTHG